MTSDSDSTTSAPAESESPSPATPKDATPSERTRPERRSLSISVATLGWLAAIAALAIVAIVLGVLLIGARHDISDREATAADDAHAEKVSLDYAVGAANLKFDDVNSWVGRLKTNTTPALAAKFEATAPKLQEILNTLRYNSTATPIAAKVMSDNGGVYQVSVFVDVNSTSAQEPNGARTTATYNITLDRNADWKITDVGGVEGALPVK